MFQGLWRRCAGGFLFLLLLTPFAPGQPVPSRVEDRVRQLVGQLGNADVSQAARAENSLIDLGPGILPFLSAQENTGLSGSQRQRLAAVTAALQAVSPRTVTLHQTLPLADALKEISKQTGIEVVDKRQVPTNPSLKLDLNKATFWQALDMVAREARVVVSPYQGNGQVALVDGSYRDLPVSYSGLFRTVVKRVTVTRDLDSTSHYCVVDLEVTWEPRLQPFYVDQEGSSVSYLDAGNKLTAVTQEGKGSTEVQGRPTLEFSVPFPAPPRAVDHLALLQGQLRVVTPSKMLLFTFDHPAAAAKAPLTQEREGVKVRLTRFQAEDDPWEVEVRLDYPPGGAHFDSYQSWLVNNEVFLEDRKTQVRQRPLQGGSQVNKSTYPHAEVVYFFSNKNDQLGKPDRWKLLYRTPGRIVRLPVRFEFKDLPLP